MKTDIAFALALAAHVAPSTAQEVKIGPDRYAVSLSYTDLGLATADDARRMLVRIDRAALAVCGAPAGSLREVTQAVRRSACRRDSMADAVHRIDHPLLTQAWHMRR